MVARLIMGMRGAPPTTGNVQSARRLDITPEVPRGSSSACSSETPEVRREAEAEAAEAAEEDAAAAEEDAAAAAAKAEEEVSEKEVTRKPVRQQQLQQRQQRRQLRPEQQPDLHEPSRVLLHRRTIRRRQAAERSRK